MVHHFLFCIKSLPVSLKEFSDAVRITNGLCSGYAGAERKARGGDLCNLSVSPWAREGLVEILFGH
jgi:hypothetical protein